VRFKPKRHAALAVTVLAGSLTAASLVGGQAEASAGTLAGPASVAAAVPASVPASAGSIVYLKGGNVWIAYADGSHARQFTKHKFNWSSPSEADNGTVVVAGGLARINAGGTDSSGSSELYRFQPNGTQIGGAIPTWGSYSSPSCPTFGPNSVRVSPDASKIAYGIWDCADASYTALWTPATATGLKFPYQTLGQEDFYEPNWITSSLFVVSHAGPTVSDSQARWFTHKPTQADDAGVNGWNWAAMSGTGAQAVINRAGTILAVFEDDAADWANGKPRNVRLWLFTDEVDGSFARHCTVTLDAAQTSRPLQLSPSFAPNGKALFWGNDKGVVEASTATPGNCASVVPKVIIPGGSEPFFSAGVEKAGLANPRQPGLKPVAAFADSPAKPRRGQTVTFNGAASHEPTGRITAWAWKFGDGKTAGGARVKHAYARAGTYTVTLTVTDGVGQRAVLTRKVVVSS
jgi:PKD domain